MRCSLQRLKDLKIFRGWVESLYYPDVSIRMICDTAILPGDSFQIQIYGLQRDMIFRADFVQNSDNSWLENSAMSMVEGTNVSLIEVNELSFEFRMKLGAAFSPPQEQARRAVSGVVGQILYLDQWTDITVLDVSNQGIGFLSPCAIPTGEAMDITIFHQLRQVTVKAAVRHCRPAKGLPGMWRTGALVEGMERLDRMVWNSMLGANT